MERQQKEKENSRQRSLPSILDFSLRFGKGVQVTGLLDVCGRQLDLPGASSSPVLHPAEQVAQIPGGMKLSHDLFQLCSISETRSIWKQRNLVYMEVARPVLYGSSETWSIWKQRNLVYMEVARPVLYGSSETWSILK